MLKKFFENVNRQTAPLTFVLSRKGREALKEYPITLPFPAGWRGEKDEKIITMPPHPTLTRGVERREGR
jgi:hypothetical protein